MKSRTFTSEDQLAFAELSGDYNPLHVDAVAARRLLFGAPVVHGIHALLWGLDSGLEDRSENVELRSLKAVFLKPIRVGDEVTVSLRHKDDRCLSLNLTSGNSTVATLECELDNSVQPTFHYLVHDSPSKLPPRALSDDAIEAASGSLDLCLHVETAAKLLPHLIGCFSPLQLAVLLSTTRLVGVMCPGLHSLYFEIDLRKTMPNKNTTMTYEVTQFDRRFGLVSIKIVAPELTGTIKAFRRPAPQEQASYLTLKKLVDSSEFVGQRALVVGGSRGLGEVAAKLLSGGGADVRITYHQGKEEARRIVDEIAANGGVADSFSFDVLNPKIDPVNVSLHDWCPTHLYYFATPFIGRGVEGIFSPQLFSTFCDYYVGGFVNTVNLLRDSGIRRIFCPSTVFIDELPTNMGEYVAAKVASEVLCAYLQRTGRGLEIYVPRFPRVATDQTVSFMPVANQDPAPIMIRELRSFREAAVSSC